MTDELDHSGDEVLSPRLDPRHEHAAPEMYPRLWNISAGFMCKAIVRAQHPARPEYVTVPLRPGIWDDTNLALSLAISKWNLLWEAARWRLRTPTGGCAASSTLFVLTGARTTSHHSGAARGRTSSGSCTTSGPR